MSAPLIAERLAHRLSWHDLDPLVIAGLIQLARLEDLQGHGLSSRPAQTGDVTSSIIRSGSKVASARLMAREQLVVCGLPLVQMVLDAYGSGALFNPACTDGSTCAKGDLLGTLTGPSRVILEAERVLLNFLQKLSGVSSLTAEYVAAMGDSPTRLLDTRKTTPGFRVLEKYAVACGGGFNHRIGLFDRVMLKDNHLAADDAGSGEALAGLVHSARGRWPGLVIELEVDQLDQITPTLDSGVDVYLLDNFSESDLHEAITLIGAKAATEASGGITIDSLAKLAGVGLDFISTGATIHKSTWKDIGLDWDE
jgi:nicotinate-nucleotide pyrophosphorylase (carboxylating)